MPIDLGSPRTIAAAIGLIALVGVAAWFPAYHDTKSLRGKIARVDDELLGVSAHEADGLEALYVREKRARAELDARHKTIPQDGELAELLRVLTSEMNELELVDANVSTLATLKSSGYESLPIIITFRGRSTNAFEFIYRVEAMPRLVQVTHVQLHASKHDVGEVTGEVQLNAYYYGHEGGK